MLMITFQHWRVANYVPLPVDGLRSISGMSQYGWTVCVGFLVASRRNETRMLYTQLAKRQKYQTEIIEIS